MDKEDADMNYYEKENSTRVVEKEHQLKLNNRRLLEITGVKEVDSFDNEEFLLETVMGYLIIRGQNLQLKNLDVGEGVVSIKGKIYEVSYVDEQHQEKAKGFFSKLFR
jgi:sporulation protein YabP